ncbi:hypothetical protein H5410_062061 [Solanum commersonii]|uniref:Uncharacterized protein n=1 Tax=Solanum commersonii TaxID=4109 RepID=A0A9J5WAE5_SOLCO|nr:hypothetical protein H5410_062061 [Solanum commersonii]
MIQNLKIFHNLRLEETLYMLYANMKKHINLISYGETKYQDNKPLELVHLINMFEPLKQPSISGY